MKYTAIMMLVVTMSSLGWEGRFNSAFEAAAQGQMGQAAAEFTQSLQQALRDQDTGRQDRPQIR